MKKSVLGISALTLALVAAGGMGTIRAEDSHDTTVTYRNSSEIDNGDPDWAVTIPTTIIIDEMNPDSTFTVEAVSKAAGQDIATLLSGKTINVTIASKNDFKLKYNNSDPVNYELDKQSMTLTASKPSETGTIKLKGIATVSGDHTDILTFSLATTTNS